jgi:hypothetical protein
MLLAAVAITCSPDAVGPGGEPAPRPVATSVSFTRDSMTLNVGDSTMVWVVGRTATGQLLIPDTVDFVVLAPAVSIATSGLLRAEAAGSALVIANVGLAADTLLVTVVGAIDNAVLTGPTDTVRGLNATVDLRATAFASGVRRNASFTFVSRDTNVLRLQSADQQGRVTAQVKGDGDPWVVATETGGVRDSVRVSARLIGPPIRFQADNYSARPGEQITPVVLSGTNTVQVATVTSADTSVLHPASGALLAKKVGNTRLVARTASGQEAFASASVWPSRATGLAGTDSPFVMTAGVIVNRGVVLDVGAVASVVSADTMILQASLVAPANTTARLVARNVGTTTIITSATNMLPETLTVRVTPPALLFSTNRVRQVGDTFSVGFIRKGGPDGPTVYAESLLVTVSSSDTTVVRIPPSFRQLTIANSGLTHFEALAIGRATLSISAPGVPTVEAIIDVAPSPKIELTASRTTMGARQTTRSGEVFGPGAWEWRVRVPVQASPLTIALSHSAPAIGQTVALDGSAISNIGIPQGATTGYFYVESGDVGVDTIIASAPGFLPDTAILTVTTPHFVADDTTITIPYGYSGLVGVRLADSLGNVFFAKEPIRFTVTSSDSSRAYQPSAIILGPVFSIAARRNSSLSMIQIGNTGTAIFTYADTAGRMPPFSLTLNIVVNDGIRIVPDNGDPGEISALGRLQRSAQSLGGAASIASLDTAILKVAPGNGISGNLLGGVQTGVTRTVAIAPHYTTAYGPWVEVGEPRLEFTAIPPTLTPQVASLFTIVLTDQRGRIRQSHVPVPIRIENLTDGTVVADTVVGARTLAPAKVPITFTRPGRFRLAVRDLGSGASYRADTVSVDVGGPSKRLRLPATATIGVGQLLTLQVLKTSLAPGEAANIQIQTPTGRISALASTLGSNDGEVTLRGNTAGDDYLVLKSTPFIAGDSTRITVTPGRLRVTISNVSSTLVLGNSHNLYIQPTDSLGNARPLANPMTVLVSTTGPLALYDTSGLRADSLRIPAGFALPHLKIGASATGTGALMVASPGYLPVRVELTVVK